MKHSFHLFWKWKALVSYMKSSSNLIRLIDLTDLNIISTYWLCIDENDTGIVSLDFRQNYINYFVFDFAKVLHQSIQNEKSLSPTNDPANNDADLNRKMDVYSIQNSHSQLSKFECISLANKSQLYYFHNLKELFVI